MELLGRLQADLARPAAAVGRDPFLVASALVIVVLAHWTFPGSAAELAGLAPAVVAFVLVGLGVKVRLELFAAVVITTVTVVVAQRGHLEGALFLPVMVTLYTSWHLGSTIRASVIMLAAAGSPWLLSEVMAPQSDMAWTPWLAANVFTFAMGLTLRNQRKLIGQLHEAREALATQAVAEERRRIARELHDLAGHTLAAMMLHVTGARHVLERDPQEAQRALQDAERVGRASLDQIRATVAALRTEERGTDAALAGGGELDALIDGYRRAGLRIDAHVDDGAAGLTGPVGTALHRIVQEALANVARHAPTNHATVSVTVAGGDLAITVSDHGRRPMPAISDRAHFGLVGMRERARALGGDLTAGPHADGWRVAATLPLGVRLPS